MEMAGRRFDPLGLCCISSFVKNLGHETIIFQETDEPASFLTDLFEKFQPDVVGFSCLDINFQKGMEIAGNLKKLNPDITTIFGGEHSTAHPEIVKDENVDIALMGEGEHTIKEILERIEKGEKDMTGIEGCSFFNGEKVIENSRRERIKYLDSLPFPDRDVIKNYNYIFPGLASLAVPLHKQKIACTYMSRGCLFDCTFCTTPNVWMRKWATRSKDHMADELEYLAKQGYNLIYFQDETFTLKPKVALGLCKEIVKRNIKIHWTCLTRLSTLNDELLFWMHKAGCFYMAVGVEAVTDKTLDKIQKKLDTAMVREKLKLIRKHNISVCGLMMMGYPWETEKQILSYSKYLNKLKLDSVRLRFLTPFKGTRLHDEIEEKGLFLANNPYHENTERPIIKMDHLSPERLVELRNIIQRRFYLRPGYIFGAVIRTLLHPSYIFGYFQSYLFFRKVQKHDKRLLSKMEQGKRAAIDPAF